MKRSWRDFALTPLVGTVTPKKVRVTQENPFRVGDRVRIVVPQGHPLWKATEEWRQYVDGGFRKKVAAEAQQTLESAGIEALDEVPT